MNGNNDVALWAGIAAFFGSVLAVGIFDLLDAHGWWALLSAVIVAGFTGAAVYAKERLNHARSKNERMEKLINRKEGT